MSWHGFGVLVLVIANLVACSHPPVAVEEPSAQAPPVDPETWRPVDRQIVAASVRARHAAGAYARIAMEEWLGLVRQRAEAFFVPWYLNYWTQQWIGARLAWYQLQDSADAPDVEERLIAYLQGQFYEQVLAPVSPVLDPQQVALETLGDYLRLLEAGIDWLPLEYGISLAAFNQHLDAIPAIAVGRDPANQASLYEVLRTPVPEGLPAYRGLLQGAAALGDAGGPVSSPDRLRALARQAVTQLADSMALRGGALAASSLLGGPWGLAISAGATAWGVVEHDRARPAMEARLRADLEAAFDVLWQQLVEDGQAGVTAPMLQLSGQIERAAEDELLRWAVPEPPSGEQGPEAPPALLF